MRLLCCILLLLPLGLIAQFTQDYFSSYTYLDQDWKLKSEYDTTWINNVTFPNTIHEILFEKKIIPDPYAGNNERDLKWIEETTWIAETEFSVPAEECAYAFLEIGQLEPFAEVYVNDKLVLTSDNGFKEWEIDITRCIIHEEKNKLTIRFNSPIKEARRLMDQHIPVLPGEERIYTRKAQYEFGWDWGPRFVTTGMHKPMTISWKKENYVEITNKTITRKSFTPASATLGCELEIYSNSDQSMYLEWEYDGYIAHTKTKKLKLTKGKNTVSVDVVIDQPQRWWPSNMGDHPYYNLNFTLKKVKKRKGHEPFYHTSVPYAFCDFKLEQKNDSIGRSFYFTVNGRPFYAKGFNYIPHDHFRSLKNKLSRPEFLISHTDQAGANMLRIWGGGYYPDDEFYRTALEYGIVIWQDFMFACAMYPGDTSFTHNVKEEIQQQVNRLKHYNNIALWCGNNENDEGWKNWGWQKQYSYTKNDSAKIWNDYVNLFHEIIPNTLKEIIPQANYVSTSPQIGWGHKESLTHGDSHYWGVWWGKEPIETFEKKVPRFSSEFGMQAMPDLSTLKQVIPETEMNFDAPAFKNHQKHPTGFETLNHYLEKYLVIPKNMEDYSYATQVLQAITLKTAIEAQRRAKPRCMGTLIWQLNDTWPVTSWSVLDYYLTPKLAYTQVAESFNDLLISVAEDSTGYNFYIVHDDDGAFNDILEWYVADFSGKKILNGEIPVHVNKDTCGIFLNLEKTWLNDIELSRVFLYTKFKSQVVGRPFHFVKEKDLKLERTAYSVTIKKEETRYNQPIGTKTFYVVEIEAKTYMPWYKFIHEDIPGGTSLENYIGWMTVNLLPGQKLSFQLQTELFKTPEDLEIWIKEHFKCLNQLLNP